MDVVFFVIFVSLFVVGVLTLFAFFPIKVSWFYEFRRRDGSVMVQKPRPYHRPKSKRGNPYRDYARLEEDTFDDLEL